MRRNQHQTQKQNLKNNLKTEDGSGLVLSLMVLLVLSVLGSALGILTIRSHNLADITRDSSSAYYIAEAGANMAYEEVENYVLEAYEDSTIATDFFGKIEEPFGEENNKNTVVYQEDFAPQNGDQPKATVNIKENTNNEGSTSDKKQYIIESTGDIDGKTKTVEKAVDIEWLDKEEKIEIEIPSIPANAAIIAKEEIIFPNSGNYDVIGDTLVDSLTKVEGHAATNHTQMTNNEAITVGSINWDPYNKLITQIAKIPQTSFETPYVDSENNLKVDNNLSIDTAGKNVNLIVNDLTINANLNITGNGRLNIYVQGDLKITGNVNNLGKTNQMNILHLGDNNPTFNNSEHLINGSLFTEKSSVIFGSNTEINGIIISGGNTVSLGNPPSKYSSIIAPNAEVTLSNNTGTNGVVIANKITLGNSNEIKYGEIDIENFPFGSSGDSGNKEGPSIEDLISSQPAIEP